MRCDALLYIFFFQAEDGIRDLVRSRGLGDVYKRQDINKAVKVARSVKGVVSVKNDMRLK